MSGFLANARRPAQLRAPNPDGAQYERNEINEKSLAKRWCWICGDDATAALGGRDYCERHTSQTPALRALAEACELYDRLGGQWDHLCDRSQPVGDELKRNYFAASTNVHELRTAVRADAEEG